MKTKFLTVSVASFTMLAGPVLAQTDIQWWHAMGGRLGEVVEEIAANYNASQDEYNLIPTY